MSNSRPRLHPSGFGLAALAFALTRLLVTGTDGADIEAFVYGGVVPLAAGLGLTLFGVAIGVGAVSREYARSVWRWSVLATFATVLVLATTATYTVFRGQQLDALWERSSVLIANVFLGAAILGTIVGDRLATQRRTNEELVQYAERAMLVNRLLRHEVLNAVAIVRGYAETDDGTLGNSTDAIRESAESMERTVEHASEFAGTTGEIAAVDVAESVSSVLETLPDDVDVTVVGSLPEHVLVRADDRLDLLVAELLENAIVHAGPDASVLLEVVENARTVELTVRDDGPGLPEPAKSVLAARSLPEYDDPSFGYGLQMVRLLVEQYEGAIEATYDDGTELTVTLQRTRRWTTPRLARGVPTVDLYRSLFAGVVAGTAMGLLLGGTVGGLSQVGSLYGVESALIGWVAHLFHSAVFGLLFAALCTVPRLHELASSIRGRTGLGAAWGLLLWLVASGLVMPVWMLSVGLDATVPNLTIVGLLGHLLWGATLGVLYAVLPDEEWLPR